ncbi:MBL fold metallo-hydrolase [Actinoalloteichus sp. AHMU CJ021]|uniref:MBL fold metallo-hydrolase n=1 Tax=Actinoalloteichus sp. AHMU CJ021 TaxID=2072503 RepID=UPI000CA0191A|nr:MBL fold metallo-hydrolase [Actinoalloteichus sp. AHMU CJ021]
MGPHEDEDIGAGTWIEVGDRVWARRYRELDLSVGLVVGRDRCLVVDTRGDREQGAEFAAEVRALTELPWTVVLTHVHFDHCFGSEAFLPCPVWAHPDAVEALERTAAAQRTEWVARYRAEGRSAIADRLDRVRRPVLPRPLPADPTTFDLGGRTVLVRHLGRGHTDHDVVVEVPDTGTVFAGDLVEQGAPPDFGDSYPLEWPGALRRLAGLVPANGVVVPGHGEPVDAAFVLAQADDVERAVVSCQSGSPDRAAPGSGEPPYPEETMAVIAARVRATRPEVPTSPPTGGATTAARPSDQSRPAS